MRKLIFGLLLFAILGVAMAADGNESFGSDVRKAVMRMHASQLECRVDFIITMLDYSEGYTGKSYEEIKYNLKANMENVRAVASGNNPDAFLEAVKKTKSHFRTAVQTIHDAREEGIKNYNRTNRSELIRQMKDDFDSVAKEFNNCHVDATRKRISAEVSMNKQWIEEGKKTAERMRQHNYNTDKVEDIVRKADRNTEEMKKIAGKEKEVEKLLGERKTRWEHHLWLWAQYHKERLNLFLDRIIERTDGYEERVEEIRGILERAAGIGDDEYYTLEEYREARLLILEATDEIRELTNEIQGAGTSKGEEE